MTVQYLKSQVFFRTAVSLNLHSTKTFVFIYRFHDYFTLCKWLCFRIDYLNLLISHIPVID